MTVVFLPGVVIHELGHVLGFILSKILARYTVYESITPSYWGAPVLNLAVAAASMYPALTDSVFSSYLLMVNLFCGTVFATHDWNYGEGYSEEELQESREKLLGQRGENHQ